MGFKNKNIKLIIFVFVFLLFSMLIIVFYNLNDYLFKIMRNICKKLVIFYNKFIFLIVKYYNL